MKEHLISLMSPQNYRKTILLFIAGLLLITASQVIETTDNLPGLLALFCGMILVFFSVLHPWKQWKKYAKLALWALLLIVITFLIIGLLSLMDKTEYISEGLVMILTILICLPAIITGILGALYWLFRSKTAS